MKYFTTQLPVELVMRSIHVGLTNFIMKNIALGLTMTLRGTLSLTLSVLTISGILDLIFNFWDPTGLAKETDSDPMYRLMSAVYLQNLQSLTKPEDARSISGGIFENGVLDSVKYVW